MAEVARSFLLLSRKLARESSELRHPDWNSDLTLTEQSVPGRGSSAAGARSCRGRLQVVRRGPWADSLRGRGVAAAASPGASWIRGVELLAGTKRAFGSRRSQRGRVPGYCMYLRLGHYKALQATSNLCTSS